jgi:anti-anti-sigma factor
MDISRDTNAEGIRIRVEGALTIEQAGQLKDALLEALQEGKGIEVDLSSVRALDLAGMQLLCAAHRSAMAGGTVFRVAGWHEELAGLPEAYGFRRARGCCPEQDAACLWIEGGPEHG